MAQICYIRCLIHHFEDFDDQSENHGSFQLRFAQMNNPQGSKKYFKELERAGLVSITDKYVEFLPVWHRHIDRQRLDRPNPMLMPGFDSKPAREYAEQLKGNQYLKELIAMRYRYSKEKADIVVNKLIDEFVIEQSAKNKLYRSGSEATSHCIGWIGRKLPVPPIDQSKGTGTTLLGF